MNSEPSILKFDGTIQRTRRNFHEINIFDEEQCGRAFLLEFVVEKRLYSV